MSAAGVLDCRRAGVLLHPTSLPGGTLGRDAERFLDFLAATGTSVWQMLPLGPTHEDASPYHCLSVHALNPALLSVERLVEEGWIDPGSAAAPREDRLAAAFARLQAPAAAAERAGYEAFCERQAHWLEDFAMFQALRERFRHQTWWQWPAPLRDRESSALVAASVDMREQLSLLRLEQFLIVRQFERLRAYAGERGILLFGDMPIFVAHDSAEVWAQREYFRLDARGHPQVVAGVPPDYFSATGQRWGNPLYDWERMQADGFRWWGERLATDFARFDLVRVDHFRGFEACWEIPAREPTAVHGRWVKVPGVALFDALAARFGRLPLVAEDLGTITPEVTALRERYGFPGMLVLQFAFDSGPDNPYLPHNHRAEAVVYTGTHDNDTTLAWYEALPEARRQAVRAYLDTPEAMPWALVHAALASVARLAIIPMQDLLGLGAGQRMNTPGVRRPGNWQWRFAWEQLTPPLCEQWGRWLARYGRGAASVA
jgi:4-alpha-glucanotransferase